MVVADFEADIEIDKYNIGNKTTNIYKQNPVLNGLKLSELEDVLKSGYNEPPLCYNKVDWLKKEVEKLENKFVFFFKNTKKDIIMTEENEAGFDNNNICRFCEKNIKSDKVKEDLLITLVIQMLNRKIVSLYHLHFIFLVITIAIRSSKNYSI